MWLLQSDLLTGVNDAIQTANEARDIVLLFIVVLLGAGVIINLVRRTDKSDERSDQTILKLIDFLGKLTEAVEHMKDGGAKDAETRRDLTEAIKDLRESLVGFQKTSIDHQKLIDSSLSVVNASLDDLKGSVTSQFEELSVGVKEILGYVKQHPEQHEELKKLLGDIIERLKTREVPTVQLNEKAVIPE